MPQRVEGGYLDVYRRCAGSVAAGEMERIAAAVGQLLRVHALIGLDADRGPRSPRGLGEQPRPVLDVVNEQLAAQSDAARERNGDARPVRRDPDASLARSEDRGFQLRPPGQLDGRRRAAAR